MEFGLRAVMFLIWVFVCMLFRFCVVFMVLWCFGFFIWFAIEFVFYVLVLGYSVWHICSYWWFCVGFWVCLFFVADGLWLVVVFRLVLLWLGLLFVGWGYAFRLFYCLIVLILCLNCLWIRYLDWLLTYGFDLKILI